MITEDYVSFEVAKLLKEKGFQAKCTACYHSDPSHTFELISGRINYCNPRFRKYKMIPPYNAPTIQMAMKWLRLEHSIDIIPFHEKLPTDCYWCRIEKYPYTEYQQNPVYSSQESACDASIRYCLENLI